MITPGNWTDGHFGTKEGNGTASAEEDNRGNILLSIELGDGVNQTDDENCMILSTGLAMTTGQMTTTQQMMTTGSSSMTGRMMTTP